MIFVEEAVTSQFDLHSLTGNVAEIYLIGSHMYLSLY